VREITEADLPLRQAAPITSIGSTDMRDGKIVSTVNDRRVTTSSSNVLELDTEQLSDVSGGRVHSVCASGKHIPIVRLTMH
jgi:hypothetical protein